MIARQSFFGRLNGMTDADFVLDANQLVEDESRIET